MEINADRVGVATSPRLGIVINLDDLETLMREFVTETKAADGDDDLTALTLSLFLKWTQRKVKIHVET